MEIIGVDIDDTICVGDYHSAEGCTPLPGAVEALWKLKDQGYLIWYYTTRSWHSRDETLAWLVKWGFPVDEVLPGKPNFFVYIGNEAISFQGDWGEVVQEVLERSGS